MGTFLSFVFLVGWQLASGLNVVAPVYPANAVRGGNVIAVIEPSQSASTRVLILYADEPFGEPTRTALAQWRLPDDRKDKATLAVVNFRNPFLSTVASDHGVKLGPQSRRINVSQHEAKLPVPTLVVDPLYSDASLVVMGASILHVDITVAGSVDAVQVVQPLGDYTQASVEAVKKWAFLPAKDDKNRPVASDAFAVCVYRPVQNPLQ